MTLSWDQLADGAVGGPVTRGAMFGSQGLRTDRKFFALWWRDHLVLKLPTDRLEGLIAAGGAEPFEPMAGRRMNGWAVLRPADDWPALVDEAQEFVAAQQR